MGVVIVEEPIDRALSRPANGSSVHLRASDGSASVSGVGHEGISEPGPKVNPSRPAVVETPNAAGEIMTKDVVSVLVGTSVRDVAIRLLEKRISAVPVLAAKLQLLGMVSEGPTTAARKRTPGAWLTSACSHPASAQIGSA